MASYLSKFISGAAGTAGTLYADQYQQEIRAKLTAKRDEVLQANREKERTTAREQQLSDVQESRAYAETQTQSEREYKSKESELDRQNRIQTSRKSDKPINTGVDKQREEQVKLVFNALNKEAENSMDLDNTETAEMRYKRAVDIVNQRFQRESGEPAPKPGEPQGVSRADIGPNDVMVKRNSDGKMFVLINGQQPPVPIVDFESQGPAAPTPAEPSSTPAASSAAPARKTPPKASELPKSKYDSGPGYDYMNKFK